MQLIPVVNKDDFKYFKPWLTNNNDQPKWVEKLESDTLKNVLTKDSEEGQDALKKHQAHWRAQKNRVKEA